LDVKLKTPAEIQANMNGTLLGTEPGLVAYYDFEAFPGSLTFLTNPVMKTQDTFTTFYRHLASKMLELLILLH
jgi:hypothetical protein